jgi:ATP-dependent RNA helicase DDX10/DBP4
MLVLDEADEILSLGFQNTLSEILNAVPRNTQTLLFSATLSKKILALSKVALKDPEHIFLHNRADPTQSKQNISNVYETPLNLQQYAMTIPHEDKIDVLFSFLRTHKQSKTIVFVSCCKQARFLYESFKKLRVGIPIFELQGRQKQPKRMAIFFTFSEKRRAVLITTNIAARGLDFPKVDWVVQFDIPENTETYVHRIGRTARFTSKGKSLMLIDPSEVSFLDQLKESGSRIASIVPNPSRQLTIRASLQIICSEEQELKYLAQKAFISFIKNVHFMPDKSVFNVSKINVKALAESYGLVQTPVIQVNEKEEDEESDDGQAEEEEEGDFEVQENPQTRKEKPKSNSSNPNQKNVNQLESVVAGLMPNSDPSKLSKSAKKLLKFKEKMRLKKQANNDNGEEEDEEATTLDPILLKNVNSRLNQTRETQLIDRAHKIAFRDVDQNDDDLLLIKRRDAEIDIDAIKEDPWKTSKRQLKKIKPEGIFGGKNIFEIDEDNNVISQTEKEMRQLRKNLQTAEEEDLNFIPLYATKLAENEDLDRDIATGKAKDKKAREKLSRKMHQDDKRQSFKGGR